MNKNIKIYFMGVFLSILVTLLCYFSIKSTYASFGGMTGTLTMPQNVTYISNWNDDTKEDETFNETGKKGYLIHNNMFIVPEGYEFLGWNTLPDGSGNSYKVNDSIDLTSELSLYAQWNLIVIKYGDINEDGVVDNNDYLLIEEHISEVSILKGSSLRNADVNNDGKVDLVDSDILKQVNLGTVGYIDILPNKPILVYEIYKEDSSLDNNIAAPQGGSGIGENNAGAGNASGNLNGGTVSNGNGTVSNNKPTNNNQNNNSNSNNNEQRIYEFKFYNGNMEYAVTKCDVNSKNNCKLVLPVTNPSKTGYRFTGWSSVIDCPTNEGIVKSLEVNKDGNYYACFIKDSQDEKENNQNYYSIVLIVIIWFFTILGIYRGIVHFKNRNMNND